MPEEKDEYIEEEFERSIRQLSDCNLVDSRFILEGLAFRSPDDPNVLYDPGICYSGKFPLLTADIIETSYHEIQDITQICIQQTSDIIVTVILHIAGGA